MAGGDDDYADAFKKAKLEHDRQLEAPTEAKRLQAEADADIAVLSNVVLPQPKLGRLPAEFGLRLRHGREEHLGLYFD